MIFRTISSLALLSAGLAASAAPLQFVNLSNVVPAGATLRAVTTGPNGLVAVGDGQRIVSGVFAGSTPLYTSPAWSATNVDPSISLNGVAASPALFVASGQKNHVFVSADAIHWIQENNVFNNDATVAGLSYNGRFVAVARAPQIGHTTDPENVNRWSAANLAGSSFAESFRSVAPFQGGFLSGGAFGVVRISTDGTVWTLSRNGGLGDPELLGVASRADTLVAVGGTVGAPLAVVKQGAAAWTTAALPGGTPLLSAAVNAGPHGFLAVGNGGTLLQSADGAAWSAGPNSRTANDLLGASYDSSASGLFRGIAVLVGANGTLVVGGTNPPAPHTNILSHLSVCAGTTTTLEVGVTNSAGSDVITVDWFHQVGANLFPVTNSSLAFTPPPQPVNLNVGAVSNYVARARDLRTGLLSESNTLVTLTHLPRPSATLSADVEVCNGEPVVVTATLSGAAPWIIVWSSNNVSVATNIVNVPTISFTNTPFNPFLNAATNFTYAIASLVDSNCVAIPAVDLSDFTIATVNPRPTSTLITNATFCSDTVVSLFADLTGIGPWTVVLSSNGVPVQTNVNVAASPARFDTVAFNPYLNSVVTQYFAVTAVTDSNCEATLADLSNNAELIVNPRPTATLVTNVTLCNDSPVSLFADLTGIGPWTAVLSSNGIPVQTNVNVLVSPTRFDTFAYNPHLNAATNQVFSISALVDANCVAQSRDLTNNAIVTVNPRPTATFITNGVACNDELITLRANLTGIGPWTVTWSSNGIPFKTNINVAASPAQITTTANTPYANSATTQVFSVTALVDANCVAGAADLTNNAVFTVNPRPTVTFVTNTVECSGAPLALFADLTGIGPWTVVWSSNNIPVLTNVNVASSPVQFNTTAFNPHPNNVTNQVFSVSSLSDANCTADPVDRTNNVVITVNPRPTAIFTTNNVVANEQPITIYAPLTGLGPWTVVWSSNGIPVQTNLNVTASPDSFSTLAFNPSQNTLSTQVFNVTALSDSNCVAGPSDLVNSATFTVSPRPRSEITTLNNTICNGDTNAIISFRIDSGIPPWRVVWTNGSISFTQVVTALPGALPVFTNLALNGATPFQRPTNTLPGVPVTNQYWIASLSDFTGIVLNFPGDITGTNLTRINPRPRATVNPATNVVCVTSTNAFVRAQILSGLSPWTLVWTDGALTYTQQVTQLLPPPFPFNADLLLDGSEPFRTLVNPNPSTAVTRRFWLQSLTDGGVCAANRPGDLSGTNTVVIDPLPTVDLSTTNLNIFRKITGGGNNKNVNVDIFLEGTLTGLPPWTLRLSDGQQSATITTNNPNLRYRWQVDFYKGTEVTNITIAVTNLIGSACSTTNGLDSVTVTISQVVNAEVVTETNIICNGQSAPIHVSLGGRSPWRIVWSDGVTNNSVATNFFTRIVTPTNAFSNVSTTFTYTVVRLTDNLDGGSQTTTTDPADLTGEATVVVLPVTTNAPVPLTNYVLTCSVVTQTLSVAVQPGFTADWFDAATNALAGGTGTTNFVPSHAFSERTTNVFLVSTRFDAPGGFCASSNLATITFVVEPCTNVLWIAPIPATNSFLTNAVLSWYGNWYFQQASNLPAITTDWLTITQGVAGVTNYWTNTVPAPTNNAFYRLSNQQ